MAWNEPGNNNRDPWSQGGGGKGGPTPPDLKDLFKRLQARWGGGSGKERGGLLLLLAALVVLGLLLRGFYTVGEGERFLVTRLGAYSRTDGPGLHWHLLVFEKVLKKINVGILRQLPARPVQMLTKDQNLVEVGLALQFKVTSAEDYSFNNVDNPEDIVVDAATSALQQVVGAHTIDEVVGRSDLSNSQLEIAAATRQLLQQILDSYHSGVQLTEASLKVEPPEALQPAFADVIKAAEDRRGLRNDAQAYADSRVPAARAEAARNITEAQAYRDQVIARAEGDVARFAAVLAEYRKSPQVTRKRLYLDTMGEIYARSGKMLVDVDKGNFSFTVPVEQLLAPPAPQPETAPAAAPSAAPPASDNGGDDNGPRSRSRGGR
ncbi:MAG: FtsH protease activity modulator HflK [Nevskia sp.]|nr:FtsH protease activity modulator HflK [Nevskia sp.]